MAKRQSIVLQMATVSNEVPVRFPLQLILYCIVPFFSYSHSIT